MVLPISFLSDSAFNKQELWIYCAHFMYWNYVSCCLTIVSTLLVGKRLWHGWILAAINSAIICLIGFQTRQWGFIPANVFCLVLYAHNIRKWRVAEPVSLTVSAAVAANSVESQMVEAEPIKVPFRKKAPPFRKSGIVRTVRLRRFRNSQSGKRSAHHSL